MRVNIQNRSSRASSRAWRPIAAALMAFVLLVAAALAALPAVSPAAGASTADSLRAVVGPGPVAQLESVSSRMRDTLYRALSSVTGGGPRVSWAGAANVAPDAGVSSSESISSLAKVGDAQGQRPGSQATLSPNSAGKLSQLLVPDAVAAAPGIGWQAYGPEVNGVPQMARAMLMVDPQRSCAGVALVRIDLSRLQLHMVPGSIEPAHPSGIDQLFPNLGMVAPQDVSRLVAAFNGGFKGIHGHYGMTVEQTTLLPPLDGLATIAVYKDGNVRIGAWGRGVSASPDLVSFSQNCPPLIEDGQINPALSTDARKSWGFTNSSDVTWRTGLGITGDRRFLIYAVGNGTHAEFLAEALLKAGAYNAMQLDINQYYAHFVTYPEAGTTAGSAGSPLVAEPLLQQMINVRDLYLTPNVRDFFYLTARQ